VASKLYQIAFEIGGKLAASLPKSMTSAAAQLSKLGQQISALERAQGTATRFRSLHNEIDATKLKLRQAEADVKRFGATVGPMTAAAKRSFAEAEQRVAALRGQLKGQLVELKGVRSAMDAAGIGARTFAADNAKLAAQLAKARAEQQRLREKAGAHEAAKARLGANREKMKDARASLSQAEGNVLRAAAGVAAFVLPVKIAADFEDSMVRAGALARATDGELATLTNTARQLGRDTRFSATQAATGMQFLAQSGFKVNEIVAAMPGMLNIASAGAVELGEAADITSNILRGFGMQAGESGRLGDVLTNTFTNSSTNLSQLGETMKYVGPVARAMGLSLESTAAAAGLLGNAGIKGEQAGTGLRAMMLRLASPMRAGKDELARLGVKTMDAHKNMRPLSAILEDLSKKTAKFGTGARQASIKTIFGMEAATAATVLIGEAGSGNLQKFTEAVKRSGTAAEVAAKQNATMKGQWDNLYGSIEDVGIQIGNMMIPTLKRLIDKMVPVINNVTTWLQQHPQLTEQIVLGAAALAVLVLGLTVAGVAFSGARVGILAAQGAMLLLKTATWQAVGAFVAANAPIALATAGIAGLVYAAYDLKRNWNVVRQWWIETWDDMFNSVARVWNAIPRVIRDAMTYGNGEDMQLDVFKKAEATRLNLAQWNAGGAYTPWVAGGGEKEPTWLKKGAKFGGAAELKPGSAGKGDTVYSPTFAPQIHMASGAEGKGDVEKGLATAQREFEKMMKRLMQQEGRLAAD
jgi:TP901 family phage tail tape measure protein